MNHCLRDVSSTFTKSNGLADVGLDGRLSGCFNVYAWRERKGQELGTRQA